MQQSLYLVFRAVPRICILQLNKTNFSLLEKLDSRDKKSTARLTNAYDTLKMLYFKDFKEYSEDNCYSPEFSPSFEKMTEALAPKNYNYASWQSGYFLLLLFVDT